MKNGFLKNFIDYLPQKVNFQIKELYVTTAIMDFASSMVIIFEPIYLYKISKSLQFVLLYYIAVYLIYFFVLPLGAKIAKKKGYEHAISYSSVFLILYYLFLFAMSVNIFFAGPAVLCLVLNKSLYWCGYHSDFARYGESAQRGKEISNRVLINYLVTIFGPILGGLILKFLGFPALFVAVSVLILVSNIPILSTKEEFTPTPFPYKDAYKRLCSTEHSKKFFAYFGFGEEFIFMILWPIFIFLIMPDFFSIGFLMTAAILITSLASLFIGKMADANDKKSVLRLGSILQMFSWFIRIFIRGPLGIFSIETLYRTAKNTTIVPMIALTYERAMKKGVMKSVVFMEMVIAISKLLIAAAIFIYISFFPMNWEGIFVSAGMFSLLYSLF